MIGIGQAQPSQAVDNWTDEEYIKNLRFLLSQFNNSLNNVPALAANGSIS